MKVSVFLPYYNDIKFLGQAIEAVLAQTHKDFELVLLDHASTDGSADVAKSFSDPRIRHVRVPVNYGAGAGVNLKAFLRVATGDFVKLLCADDILLPNGLELLVAEVARNPSVEAVFGDCEIVDKRGLPVGKTLFGRAARKLKTDEFYSGTYDNARLLPLLAQGRPPWPYPGAFIKKRLLDEIDFDTSMIFYFDVSLWVDLVLREANVAFVKTPILKYRIHDGQTSSMSQKQRMAKAVAFESEKLAWKIANCANAALIKRAFSDSPLAQLCETDEDVRFVVHEWLLRNLKSRVSYCALANMLDDDALRTRLSSRFGFSIRTLRAMYMEWDEFKPAWAGFQAWKKRVKQTTGECLGVWGLVWLLSDRIWKNATFKK